MTTTINYPTSLPQTSLQSAFKAAYPNNVLATTFENGNIKTRPRHTIARKQYSMGFFLSSAQITTFNTFWQTTLKQGASAFNMRHPVLGTSGVFRFSSPPILSRDGTWYLVTFTIEEVL